MARKQHKRSDKLELERGRYIDWRLMTEQGTGMTGKEWGRVIDKEQETLGHLVDRLVMKRSAGPGGTCMHVIYACHRNS